MMKKVISYLILVTVLACNDKNAEHWRQMEDVYSRIIPPEFPDEKYVITDFYNGTDTLYTNAINQAIFTCSANGGGMVVVPEGIYYTGPIRLKSNVNLHLSDGAVLKFSTDYHLFDVVKTRIEGIDCFNISPLIYAFEETNIAVTGSGVMDGQATVENWFHSDRLSWYLDDSTKVNEKTELYRMKSESVPFGQRIFKGKEGIRPQFINFYKCKNILLEGFTINRSPFWLIHPLLSENVIIRKVTMQSHGRNNDGCDPESCRDVLIEDCYFDTGDDCIAIKSGRDEDGRYWNIPCENIIVRECRMKDGHAGVAIGSEVTGGCFNVWVENCRMDSPELDRIIRIKSSSERGGEVKNVYVRNIEVGECGDAILGVEMNYWRVYDGDYPPYFHNIHIENITSKKSRHVLSIDGLRKEVRMKDVFIKNCVFDGVTEPGINKITSAENIRFENVRVNGKDYKQ